MCVAFNVTEVMKRETKKEKKLHYFLYTSSVVVVKNDGIAYASIFNSDKAVCFLFKVSLLVTSF